MIVTYIVAGDARPGRNGLSVECETRGRDLYQVSPVRIILCSEISCKTPWHHALLVHC